MPTVCVSASHTRMQMLSAEQVAQDEALLAEQKELTAKRQFDREAIIAREIQVM